MIFSAHQISFLPWLGFWQKLIKSDYFDLSIYDQFTNNTWIHFTYIGEKNKLKRLNLPLEKEYLEHSCNYNIRDIKVKKGFAQSLLDQFEEVHRYDKHFEEIFPLLNEWIKSVENLTYLWEINLILIQYMYQYLNLSTKLVLLPYLNDDDNVSKKIKDQCLMLKCDKYLSGPHGKNYLNIESFNNDGVDVVFQETTNLYNKYPQSIVSLISQKGIVEVIKLLHTDDKNIV